MKRIKLIILAAIATTALVGCAPSLGTSPKGLEVPIEKAAVKFSADVKEGGYKLVNTEELKKWLDEGKKMTIISTLPLPDDQQFGLLPAAVNGVMPKSEKELTPTDKDHLLQAAGPDKDQTLVVYCGFVACRRSHIGAKVLIENGYSNVYRFPGGITAWQEMGYNVVK